MTHDPEYAQPDAEAVPFESIPVQDNDEVVAQDDAEAHKHPDELAGGDVGRDPEVDQDTDTFDAEPDVDDGERQ